jgi:hypothetical protein
MANGRDALDHSLVVEPNQEVSGMLLTFVDRTQEVSGTIQDTMGKPTSDYTIILFRRRQDLLAAAGAPDSVGPPGH